MTCGNINFASLLRSYRSRGSSVSIVFDYGLNDQAIRVRSPAGAKDFSSNLCVQTGSEVHPASCPMGTGGPFPGEKRGRGVTLSTHLHLVPRSGMSRSYISCPPAPPWRVAGLLCFFLYCCHIDELGSRVSSGSIVFDCGLDDRAIGVRSPAGAEDFSSRFCVQTGSGAHPVSCTMGTGVPFPGAKRGRGVTLTTHLHLVPRS
jgi:hypothetical protein